MVFLLIKFFAEITYQWITVTHLLLQPPPFSSFVVPAPGMGVISDRLYVKLCRHSLTELMPLIRSSRLQISGQYISLIFDGTVYTDRHDEGDKTHQPQTDGPRQKNH
jgi:hypothetical protein